MPNMGLKAPPQDRRRASRDCSPARKAPEAKPFGTAAKSLKRAGTRAPRHSPPAGPARAAPGATAASTRQAKAPSARDPTGHPRLRPHGLAATERLEKDDAEALPFARQAKRRRAVVIGQLRVGNCGRQQTPLSLSLSCFERAGAAAAGRRRRTISSHEIGPELAPTLAFR